MRLAQAIPAKPTLTNAAPAPANARASRSMASSSAASPSAAVTGRARATDAQIRRRILRVDQIGAAGERRSRLGSVRDAHQQSHRALLYHLVVY
jgi:hypothetical protein